jgi:hypothetical protein
MTNIWDQFYNDPSEVEGIWLEYPSGKLKIKRAGGLNTEFQAAYARALRPYAEKGMTFEDIPKDEEHEIIATLYAENIALDWTFKDRGGKVMKFTVERAKKLFMELPDFLRDVRVKSQQADRFRKKNLGALEKN